MLSCCFFIGYVAACQTLAVGWCGVQAEMKQNHPKSYFFFFTKVKKLSKLLKLLLFISQFVITLEEKKQKTYDD